LKTRSGNLARAIHGYKDARGDFHGYVGVGDEQAVGPYAWLLGQRESKTIRAKSGGLLAIPVGNALTEAGVPRYSSPNDLRGQGYRWFKNPKTNKILFGKNIGGHLDILFVGKESVTIETTGILPETVEERIPNIARSIKKEIMKTIVKLGIR
jgi:hypothetical protein